MRSIHLEHLQKPDLASFERNKFKLIRYFRSRIADIKQLKDILIPVLTASENHWVLVHIRFKDRQIVILDPLHNIGYEQSVTKDCRDYLRATLVEELSAFDIVINKAHPQQHDGFNCGVSKLSECIISIVSKTSLIFKLDHVIIII
jgi:Ulp1 family protease